MDITLPGRAPRLGSRHPLSLIREEVSAIFSRLGYQVLEGPEIEDDYHNFEALNMPAEHPARDMQDTLYLAEPLMPASYDPPTRGRAPHAPQPLTLLRTHTLRDADPADGAPRSAGAARGHRARSIAATTWT